MNNKARNNKLETFKYYYSQLSIQQKNDLEFMVFSLPVQQDSNESDIDTLRAYRCYNISYLKKYEGASATKFANLIDADLENIRQLFKETPSDKTPIHSANDHQLSEYLNIDEKLLNSRFLYRKVEVSDTKHGSSRTFTVPLARSLLLLSANIFTRFTLLTPQIQDFLVTYTRYLFGQNFRKECNLEDYPIYETESPADGYIYLSWDEIALPSVEEWIKRPLNKLYPILYIFDTPNFSIQEAGAIRNLVANVILGINMNGKKEILSITIGDNKSTTYWTSVLDSLKNRGLEDVLLICTSKTTSIKEAIKDTFSNAEWHPFFMNQIINTLNAVSSNDKKTFASDLKTIYLAPNETEALAALKYNTKKWKTKYPNCMKQWTKSWEVMRPIFKFSSTFRKTIYITNVIKNLNSMYCKTTQKSSAFTNAPALLKHLYSTTFQATQKWTVAIRNWKQVCEEFRRLYSERFPEELSIKKNN